MKLQVQLFGPYRDFQPQPVLELDVADGATVAAARAAGRARRRALARVRARPAAQHRLRQRTRTAARRRSAAGGRPHRADPAGQWRLSVDMPDIAAIRALVAAPRDAALDPARALDFRFAPGIWRPSLCSSAACAGITTAATWSR